MWHRGFVDIATILLGLIFSGAPATCPHRSLPALNAPARREGGAIVGLLLLPLPLPIVCIVIAIRRLVFIPFRRGVAGTFSTSWGKIAKPL